MLGQHRLDPHFRAVAINHGVDRRAAIGRRGLAFDAIRDVAEMRIGGRANATAGEKRRGRDGDKKRVAHGVSSCVVRLSGERRAHVRSSGRLFRCV